MRLEDFRVGQKVRKIGGFISYGEIGEVIEVTRDNAVIKFPSFARYSIYNSFNSFELVEDVPSDFKCGDFITGRFSNSELRYTFIARTPDGRIITVSEPNKGIESVNPKVYMWSRESSKRFKRYIEPKTKTIVKSKEALLQLFIEEGYTYEDTYGFGFYSKAGQDRLFTDGMFDYCGKEPREYSWNDEWLEEVEVTA